MAKQKQMNLGCTFTLHGTFVTLNRMGDGAMQLAGPPVIADLDSIGGVVEG